MTRGTADPTIDVLVAAASWRRTLPSAARLCRRVATGAWRQAAPKHEKRRRKTAEISVVLTSDAAIRRLNRIYRGKDKATNVLSFSAVSGPAPESADADTLILGDVVVAYGTVAREAKDAGKTLSHHLAHMVVHGVLHLLGYDHEDAGHAETMERLETEILSSLGIPDPYADREDRTPRPARPRKGRSAR